MDSTTLNDASDSPAASPKFRDPNADLTFLSSDNVSFKIHSKHLSSTSGGFDVPEFISIGNTSIQLQEPSEVLEVLFQFIHPPTQAENYKQPSLQDVASEFLYRVAEAAEKYMVYSAMNICFTRMLMDMDHKINSLEILNHSVKHGYIELANKVAPMTLSHSLVEVADKLTFPGLLAKWLKYHNNWVHIPRSIENLFNNRFGNTTTGMCPLSRSIIQYAFQSHTSPDQLLYKELPSNPSSNVNWTCPLRDNTEWDSYQQDEQYERDECYCNNNSKRILTKWQSVLDTKIAAIPKFSEVV